MYDHEDFIFSKAFSLAGKSRVPPPQQAAFFSFERRPNLLYTWTEKKLPFGCHAYKKYNSDFWQSHIAGPFFSHQGNFFHDRKKRSTSFLCH